MPDLRVLFDHLGAALIDPDPCPVCGMTPELRSIAERKRALDLAYEACDGHLARCATCKGWGGPYCRDMEALREVYYHAWTAYHGLPAGRWGARP